MVSDGCVFCGYEGPSPILAIMDDAYVIEPINPVVPGHVLVVAHKHLPDALSDPLSTGRVMKNAATHARRQVYTGGPYAWNIITSVGREATQTIDHLHIHLIPRRKGDEVQLPWSGWLHAKQHGGV